MHSRARPAPLWNRILIGASLLAVLYTVMCVIPWIGINWLGDPEDDVQRAGAVSAGLLAAALLLLGYCTVRQSRGRRT